MESSRAFSGQFKQYALVWRLEFGKRRTKNYHLDDTKYVEHNPAIWATTTEGIIESFVTN